MKKVRGSKLSLCLGARLWASGWTGLSNKSLSPKMWQEIPCYVHEGQRDTGKQCLVTDDAVPICSAKNQATTRLCSCVPA